MNNFGSATPIYRKVHSEQREESETVGRGLASAVFYLIADLTFRTLRFEFCAFLVILQLYLIISFIIVNLLSNLLLKILVSDCIIVKIGIIPLNYERSFHLL